MGFENLKKVKMSYRPNKLVPKYTIYQKWKYQKQLKRM
jgi:hypothetical protein